MVAIFSPTHLQLGHLTHLQLFPPWKQGVFINQKV